MSHCKQYLIDYEKLINVKINKILTTMQSNKNSNDILLNNYFDNHQTEIQHSLQIKHLQMKIGNIWQIAIGNYKNFNDLGIGHKSGLDIINTKQKIIMELKNRHNTDNASSRKTNYEKIISL